LQLCKEYLTDKIQGDILIPDKAVNIMIYESPSCIIIYTNYKPLIWSVFVPPYTFPL